MTKQLWLGIRLPAKAAANIRRPRDFGLRQLHVVVHPRIQNLLIGVMLRTVPATNGPEERRSSSFRANAPSGDSRTENARRRLFSCGFLGRLGHRFRAYAFGLAAIISR